MIRPLRMGAYQGPGEQDSDPGAAIKHVCIVALTAFRSSKLS